MSLATIARAVVVELVPGHQTSIPKFASLSLGWKAEIRRTVPERERITSDSVSTPVALARTPRSSEPPVTPVAATKTSSPETRSSAERTRSRSKPPSRSACPLAVVSRPQPSLDRAAHALDRRGRDDALRRAADAHQHVDAGRRLAGGDRRGDVAVANQVDAGAGLPQLGDERVVALALEHDDREVADAHPLRRRHRPHVLGRRAVEIDRAGGLRPDGDLLHVERGAGKEHRSPLGDGDDGDRAGNAEGREAGALERVDGDVDLRPEAGADPLAVEEHRRLVLLALADHDDALHRDGVDHPSHQVDGGTVGGVLVAATDPAGCSHRGRLRHPDELEGEVAIGDSGVDAGCSRLRRSYSGNGLADTLLRRFEGDDRDPGERGRARRRGSPVRRATRRAGPRRGRPPRRARGRSGCRLPGLSRAGAVPA